MQTIERGERRPHPIVYARGEALIRDCPQLVDVKATDVPLPFSPLIKYLEKCGTFAVLPCNAIRAFPRRHLSYSLTGSFRHTIG